MYGNCLGSAIGTETRVETAWFSGAACPYYFNREQYPESSNPISGSFLIKDFCIFKPPSARFE